MRWGLWTFALVGIVLLAQPRLVWAGTCGGSSGSSSSDSSSDSSSSDSDSSSGGDSEPACTDYSDAHGYAQCRSFGDWDIGARPALNLSIGVSGGSRSLASGRFRGTAKHERAKHKIDYRSDENNEDRAGYGMFEVGVSGFVSQHLYSGLHLGIGGGSVSHMQETASLRPTHMIRFELGGVIGAAIPLGDFQIRGELLAGLRSTGIGMTSIQGDCVVDLTAWDHDILLAPRVKVNRWLSPWTSVGVHVSSNADSFGQDFQLGLSITGHIRSFDRQR